jgi:hypothetical protein
MRVMSTCLPLFLLLPSVAAAGASEAVPERAAPASVEVPSVTPGAQVVPLGTSATESTAVQTADSEAAEAAFTARRFVLQLRSGVATSVGFVGTLAEFNVHERLALNAGFGTNFYGLSSAFGVRLRPLIFSSSSATRAPSAWAVTLEGSLSRGAVGEQPDLAFCIEECAARSSVVTRSVNWGQLEVGAEMRAGHYQFLGSLGWARILGNPRFTCVYDNTGTAFDCTNEQRLRSRTVVLTFAAGYAF